MKIAIFTNQSDFTLEQQNMLSQLGDITYLAGKLEQPLKELIKATTILPS